jgi:hypothetical protein
MVLETLTFSSLDHVTQLVAREFLLNISVNYK